LIICTSICDNYLPKAMALADSVKKTNPSAKFLVCLTERQVNKVAIEFKDFDYVVLSKDMGFEDFDKFIFKHSIVEASTAVKGQLFRYMLEKYPEENKFVYLDPDIIVYSELKELNQILDKEAIVLAPHILKYGNIDMELSCLKHGVYNLGFLAIKRSKEAIEFINWWAARLSQYCYDDIPNGVFTDQKWINLAPCFFDTYTLKHHGYDFATWSLKTSTMTKTGAEYFVEEDPLRFIHFSGFDSGTIDWAIKEWMRDKMDSPFIGLYKEYIATLNKFGHTTLGKLPWSYSSYSSGEKVDTRVRVYYRKVLSGKIDNPFTLSNRSIMKIGKELGNSSSEFSRKFNKGIKMLREDGVKAVVKKVFK